MKILHKAALSVSAIAAALLLPACGGGGDAAGDNYVSPLQFANGSKGFLIPSTPDLFVYATGGDVEKDMGKDALEKAFTVEGDEDADWDAPDFDEGAESVFTTQGYMRFPGIHTILCSVYYAVNGGPGGKGYMLIHPQDGQLGENNSDAAKSLINFLGCLTVNQSGADGQATNTPGSQYVIQSIAATTLRITFDFASGTSTVDAIAQITKAGADDNDPPKPEQTVVLHVGNKTFFARPV